MKIAIHFSNSHFMIMINILFKLIEGEAFHNNDNDFRLGPSVLSADSAIGDRLISKTNDLEIT